MKSNSQAGLSAWANAIVPFVPPLTPADGGDDGKPWLSTMFSSVDVDRIQRNDDELELYLPEEEEGMLELDQEVHVVTRDYDRYDGRVTSIEGRHIRVLLS